MKLRLGLVGAIALSGLAAREAHAQVYPPCNAVSDAGAQTTIYIGGSSASQPFIAAIAQNLAIGPSPIVIVYKALGSCVGVDGILQISGTSRMGTAAAPTATYWDATGAAQTCTLTTDGTGNYPQMDIGVSDVFASTCYPLPNGLPANVIDSTGPVQTMTFIAPAASTEKSISARAAYFAFGFGAASGVAPWTDPNVMWRRNASSGTQAMIAAAIGVPKEKWKGLDAGGASTVLKNVGTSTSEPDATIGILAATDVPLDNSTVRILAYQHYDQTCGYYPDSSPSSRDKQNVRDGHYAIWGPLHFLVDTTSANQATARRVVNYLTGAAPPPNGVDLIKLEANKNVVPACAMHVRRDSEVGPLQSFSPQNSCSCYFDQVVGKTPSCKTCQGNQDCSGSTPKCSFGYCEPQ